MIFLFSFFFGFVFIGFLCSVSPFTIRILHSNDLHSHFLGAGPDGDYMKADGGHARLSYMIQKLQNSHPESTLTVDAGDFSEGSIFALLRLNYDAVTFGNHEFDGGIRLLSDMIDKSKNCDVPLVLSNGHLESLFEETSFFREEYVSNITPPKCTITTRKKGNDDDGNVKITPKITPFVLKRLKNDEDNSSIVVAIIGLLGPNAIRLINKRSRKGMKIVGFDDVSGENLDEYAFYVANLTRTLREKYDVDFVITLAHSGEPEDRQFLDKLASFQDPHNDKDRLIDVHISGHTHLNYFYVHEKTSTLVSQNSAYGLELGYLEIHLNLTTKEIRLMNHGDHVIYINSRIPDDPSMARKICGYHELIDTIFVKSQKRRMILGDNKYIDFYKKLRFPDGLVSSSLIDDDGTGRKMLDWVASCFVKETNLEMERRREPKVDMYILSHEFGMFFRDNIFKFKNQTDILFSDVYRWFGVGTTGEAKTLSNWIGEDIMFFYMSQRDVKIMVNFWQLMKDRTGNIDINVSLGGISFERNWIGIPFLDHPRLGLVHSIRSFGTLLSEMPSHRLLKVAARKSLIDHFSVIPAFLSYGLVQIRTYDRFGIERDPVTSKIKEIELMFLKCLK